MVEERDASATRHLETEEAMEEAAVVVAEDWINQVWELILTSGQHLPSGSQTLTGLMRCTKPPKYCDLAVALKVESILILSTQ
jgi:hypothetical protein